VPREEEAHGFCLFLEWEGGHFHFLEGEFWTRKTTVKTHTPQEATMGEPSTGLIHQ
jgi:hypothetical protein